MQDFQPIAGDAGILIARPKHQIQATYHGHLLTTSEEAVVMRQEGQPDRVFFPLHVRPVGIE